MRYGLNILFITALLGFIALPALAEPSAAAGGAGESGGRAYLGVHIDRLTPETAAALKLSDLSGAVVLDIDQDGPACRAGLHENDVIVGFNGTVIREPQQLATLIHASSAGTVITLRVIRSGQSRDFKVTLGSMPRMFEHTPPLSNAMSGGPMLAVPMPPVTPMPDIEVPTFAALYSRNGIVVESISPQLSDFFGVDHGRGVLVRSIEKGSPADAAGLRAGDVIVKINNEVVHDVSDWRRSLRRQTGKVQLGIVRDKHPQTVEITLPGPQTTGSIPDFDGEQFDRSMDEYGRNMNQFGCDMEQFVPDRQLWANLHLDKQQLEDLRRQIESSMQELRPQLEQQMPEIRKQMEQWRPELQREMQELQKQLKEQSRQLSAMKPDARQLEEMRREIENSMKDLGPQFQRQMEEWRPQFEEEMRKFRGEMDRQKFDLQNKLPNSGSQYQF